VKEATNNCHNLVNQLAEQTRSIFKQSAYVPLADVVHTTMKEKQNTEVDLKKKVDSILYMLNPVNQVMQLSDPIVPEKSSGNTLSPKIKKLLNHRQKLIIQIEELQSRNRELLQAKKSWVRRIEEVEEEKSTMLAKLRETISILITEKQEETAQREEMEDRCMELEQGLQEFRELIREQDKQLRSSKHTVENYEKLKEHSEVIAEATSIQSIGIKKENEKLRRDCNEYQDRIQAMLTNKEGLTRQIRSQAQLIDTMKLDQVRLSRRIKTLESSTDGGEHQMVTGIEAEELAETVEMLSNENETLRQEKYALQKQVDEFDDKLNNLHMMICDLENEKTELVTENEILKTTNKTNIQLPMIDPSDPRVSQRLDQFGLLPPPPGTTVLEGIFEFLFPFLFEEEVL
jgi:FtsZ-binding cell division protein ZapB